MSGSDDQQQDCKLAMPSSLATRCLSTAPRCASHAEPSAPPAPVGRRKIMTSMLSAPVGLGLLANPSRASDTEQAERAIQGAQSAVHVQTVHLRSYVSLLAAFESWQVNTSRGSLAGADALLRSLDDRVSEFTLPNGLHFMVLERHMNPVASCHTFVNAGAYDEVDKQTGADQGNICSSIVRRHLADAD